MLLEAPPVDPENDNTTILEQPAKVPGERIGHEPMVRLHQESFRTHIIVPGTRNIHPITNVDRKVVLGIDLGTASMDPTTQVIIVGPDHPTLRIAFVIPTIGPGIGRTVLGDHQKIGDPRLMWTITAEGIWVISNDQGIQKIVAHPHEGHEDTQVTGIDTQKIVANDLVAITRMTVATMTKEVATPTIDGIVMGMNEDEKIEAVAAEETWNVMLEVEEEIDLGTRMIDGIGVPTSGARTAHHADIGIGKIIHFVVTA